MKSGIVDHNLGGTSIPGIIGYCYYEVFFSDIKKNYFQWRALKLHQQAELVQSNLLLQE